MLYYTRKYIDFFNRIGLLIVGRDRVISKVAFSRRPGDKIVKPAAFFSRPATFLTGEHFGLDYVY